uniref:Uncharacterized protein n=1 Tax=Anguilla anguilla TaxID=7936 RepID=A0A0E9PWN5_ANGAN
MRRHRYTSFPTHQGKIPTKVPLSPGACCHKAGVPSCLDKWTE